jgi:hypothetical protein
MNILQTTQYNKSPHCNQDIHYSNNLPKAVKHTDINLPNAEKFKDMQVNVGHYSLNHHGS